MTSFIDEHRGEYGVEPICRVLPIAPSTYHERVASRRDPSRLSPRAQRDEAMKPEVIHRRGSWRSFEAVEFATLEWVDWFNNRRLVAPIGNIPPVEAEERYCAMLDDTPMAA